MSNEVIVGKKYIFTAMGEMKNGTTDPKVIKRRKQKVQWVLLDENEKELHHFAREEYYLDNEGNPSIKNITFDKKYVGQTLYMTPYTDELDISVATKVVVTKQKLGMVADWSEDKKSVTVTYTVHPVNNFLETETNLGITQEQFELLIQKRIQLVESVFSGKTAEGIMMTMKVVQDPKAVITWEYNPMLEIEQNNTDGQIMGEGHTDNGIGNLYKNKNQIPLYDILKDDLEDTDDLIFSKEKIKIITITSVHEDGHIGGLYHPEDTTDVVIKRKIINDKNNLMLFNNTTGTNVLPEQLSLILQNIENHK